MAMHRKPHGEDPSSVTARRVAAPVGVAWTAVVNVASACRHGGSTVAVDHGSSKAITLYLWNTCGTWAVKALR